VWRFQNWSSIMTVYQSKFNGVICADRITFQKEQTSLFNIYFSFWRNSPTWARAASLLRFLYHTQWHTTVGRTPLGEWSTRRRDFYMTTHNIQKRETTMPPAGFEPKIPARNRQQTLALDRPATGTGSSFSMRRTRQLSFAFVYKKN
jgi:hypothetical protein